MKCNCGPLMKAIDAYLAKADNDLEELLDGAGFIDAADTLEEIESLETRVARALKKETAFMLDAAEEAIDLETYARDIWPEVKQTDDLDDKLRLIFAEELTKFMPELAAHYVAQIDSALVVSEITQRTTAWVAGWSEELGQIMKLNSHTEIENILSTTLSEGKSVAEFTQSVLDSGIRDEYYKARRVAITETLRAHSYAQEEAILQNPAVESKEWVHTGSYRNAPRENHVELNGVVVPKDEAFTLRGLDGVTYYPMCPRDSSLPPGESINCHCLHRPIVSQEILGLPLEERKRLQAEAITADNADWEAELDRQNRAKAGIE